MSLSRVVGLFFAKNLQQRFGHASQNYAPSPENSAGRCSFATTSVDVNGPTICEVLDPAGALSLLERIGPDVLRSDAKPDRAFERIAKSRAPIGRLIMGQSVMAGIGNIYRTEILWRQGVHPETPGNRLDRSIFDRIWNDAASLLALGVERNAIIIDGAEPSKSRYRERVNIFGKQTCPKCTGAVRRLDVDGRRAFVCDVCQPSV